MFVCKALPLLPWAPLATLVFPLHHWTGHADIDIKLENYDHLILYEKKLRSRVATKRQEEIMVQGGGHQFVPLARKSRPRNALKGLRMSFSISDGRRSNEIGIIPPSVNDNNVIDLMLVDENNLNKQNEWNGRRKRNSNSLHNENDNHKIITIANFTFDVKKANKKNLWLPKNNNDIPRMGMMIYKD